MSVTSTHLPATRAKQRRLHLPLGLRRALLLLPVGMLLAVFFVWPIASIFLRSLDPDGLVSWSSPSFSLDHYATALTDPTLRGVIGHTFLIAFTATAITALLAFPVAYLASRLSRRSGLMLLGLVLLQFWISILVRLFAYTQVLGREGFVNSIAGSVGLGPYSLLFNTAATVIGMVVYLLPYMVVILYAGMAGINQDLLTAARTLGATGRQAFMQVYLPLIRPSFVTGVLLSFVLSLGFFLTPAVLGGPGDTTVAIYIQQQISLFRWGTASAIGILLLVVTLIGYAAAIRAGGMASTMPGSGQAGKGTVGREPLRFGWLSVGLWTITAAVLVLLLLPLVIVAPVSFTETSRLAWPPEGFTTHWYSSVLESPVWMESIRKSAVVAAGTAVLSTAVALAVARTTSAIRSRMVRSLVISVVYAPLIVPLILLAIGLYDVQTQLGLIGTNLGLILAHTVISFPFAFAILSGALANIDPSVEHAAWTLGASRRRTFWVTVIPNIVPSLVAAFLIAFITSWDEPVIALFQTSLDKTLPVTILTQLKSGVTPALAAIATMLVASVLLMLVAGSVMTSLQTLRKRRARAGAVAKTGGEL